MILIMNLQKMQRQAKTASNSSAFEGVLSGYGLVQLPFVGLDLWVLDII